MAKLKKQQYPETMLLTKRPTSKWKEKCWRVELIDANGAGRVGKETRERGYMHFNNHQLSFQKPSTALEYQFYLQSNFWIHAATV